MAKADRMNIICTGVHVVISRPLQAGVAKPGGITLFILVLIGSLSL